MQSTVIREKNLEVRRFEVMARERFVTDRAASSFRDHCEEKGWYVKKIYRGPSVGLPAHQPYFLVEAVKQI